MSSPTRPGSYTMYLLYIMNPPQSFPLEPYTRTVIRCRRRNKSLVCRIQWDPAPLPSVANWWLRRLCLLNINFHSLIVPSSLLSPPIRGCTSSSAVSLVQLILINVQWTLIAFDQAETHKHSSHSSRLHQCVHDLLSSSYAIRVLATTALLALKAFWNGGLMTLKNCREIEGFLAYGLHGLHLFNIITI